MAIKKVLLTPELAAQLLTNIHPRQRKTNTPRVGDYARIMAAGGWIDYIPTDTICKDKATGALFNGVQRCSAVVLSGVSIGVYMDEESDAEKFFSVIDVGLRRQAHQFIKVPNAAQRASAARFILWHEQRFDRPLNSASLRFEMSEIFEVTTELEDAFTRLTPLSYRIYDRTTLSPSVTLAALALAEEAGYGDRIVDFVNGVDDPRGLSKDDPAWILHDKMNRRNNRERRRMPAQDWTIFVRCMNAYLTDSSLPRTIYTNLALWPRVGETERSLRLRVQSLISRESKQRKVHSANVALATSMAASE